MFNRNLNGDKVRTAIENNDIDFMRAHILQFKQEPNALNQCDENGETALFIAAKLGRAELTQLLLEQRANVDIASTRHGFTPIFVAAQHGHLKVVEILSAYKADVNIPATDGYASTPLLISALSGNLGVLNAVLARGAAINQTFSNGATALLLAAQNGHLSVVKALLANAAKVNLTTRDGATAVFMAAQNGYLDVVEALIQYNADVNLSWTNAAGIKLNALQIAKLNGHLEIVEHLTATLRLAENLRHAAASNDIASVNSYFKLYKNHPYALNQGDDKNRTALFQAAYARHAGMVSLLLENGADVDKANFDGETPVYIATLTCQVEVVQALLGADADVSLAKADGTTPLYIADAIEHAQILNLIQARLKLGDELRQAAANNDLAYIQAYFNRYKNKPYTINQRNERGETALFIACSKGHNDIVNLLLELGAKVNQANLDGKTPLYVAVNKRQVELVKTLLAKGANVNRAKENGASPLFSAAENGDLEIVEALTLHGANVNQAMTNGATPLLIAIQNGHLAVVNKLIALGANVNQTMANGLTPILLAAMNGNLEIAKVLVAAGADIHVRMSAARQSFTPIGIASQNRHMQIVELLEEELMPGEILRQAVDRNDLAKVSAYFNDRTNQPYPVNFKNSAGETALFIATRHGYEQMVSLLLANGSDANLSCNGFTPIFVAAQRGQLKIVEILLAQGADVNIAKIFPDNVIVTPLQTAINHNHFAVIKLLMAKPEINIEKSLRVTEASKEFLFNDIMQIENQNERKIALQNAAGKGRQLKNHPVYKLMLQSRGLFSTESSGVLGKIMRALAAIERSEKLEQNGDIELTAVAGTTHSLGLNSIFTPPTINANSRTDLHSNNDPQQYEREHGDSP